MTVTDQLEIIDNKIKANQAQYDLDRLSAKISAYFSGDLRKYEYVTGEELGYKPSVLEKEKFWYCLLGMTLTNDNQSKTNKNKNKVYNKNKQDKYFIYNSRHSFAEFKDIYEFKEVSFDSMYKKLIDFQKRFNKLKIVNL